MAIADRTLASLYPNLIREWHPTRNGNLKPHMVTAGSSKNVWWQCHCGHEWAAKVQDRTRGSNCLECHNRRRGEIIRKAALKRSGSLADHPDIAQQWHPTKNGDKTPEHYSPGSGEKVWWQCNREHEWEARIGNRVRSSGCPYCTGHKAGKDNNLAVQRQDLATEWHSKKNGGLTPSNVRPRSSKKAWWQCKYGHEWQARIADRTAGNNCPKCKPQTSRIEIRIYCELLTIFGEVRWREKIDMVECDIFLPKYRIGLEVDGYYWHKGREEKDRRKGEQLRDKGVQLLRLREKKLRQISPTDTVFHKEEEDLSIINGVLRNLLLNVSLTPEDKLRIHSYLRSNQIKNNEAYNKIISVLPGPVPEASLAASHRQLVSEWNSERNYPLLPEFFSPGSHMYVWWQCQNKGHEWRSKILNRTLNDSGCPYCSGHRAAHDYNLAVQRQELAREWNSEKNGQLTPYDVTPKSSRKVWWRCRCGHEWQAKILSRSVAGTGCQRCYERMRPILTRRAAVKKRGSLAATHPQLAKEWHLVKNGDERPEDYSPGSSEKVWWRCQQGHEWEATIGSRVQRRGCPKCRDLNRGMINRRAAVRKRGSLLATHPQLVKQWHPTKNGEKQPENYSPGSQEVVWWRCQWGHEWKATIGNRVRDSGCPKCHNEIRGTINRKAALRKSGSLAATHPWLATQWHRGKNGGLKPEIVTAGSGVKVWWQCHDGHEWQATIDNRTHRGSGCPYCTGKRPHEKNNLAFYYLALAKDWHPTKNGDLTPQNVTAGSGRKVWWCCQEGHEWQARISDRTCHGSGCPKCAKGRKGARLPVDAGVPVQPVPHPR